MSESEIDLLEKAPTAREAAKVANRAHSRVYRVLGSVVVRPEAFEGPRAEGLKKVRETYSAHANARLDEIWGRSG